MSVSWILELYKKYISFYPEDVAKLGLLADQLANYDQDITSRKNFIGHITASVFVVNKNTHQVLLLEHKFLGELLQPGGHIDVTDSSLLAAALRELEEETGLKIADLSAYPLNKNIPEVPFDIDTHLIPANPKKGEPEHYHHDFRYLFLTEKMDIEVDLNESNGFSWVSWEKFTEYPHFAVVAERIEKLSFGSR